MVRRAEGSHEFWLQSGLDTIEDMYLDSGQTRYSSRQETNRTRAGHQQAAALPYPAPTWWRSGRTSSPSSTGSALA